MRILARLAQHSGQAGLGFGLLYKSDHRGIHRTFKHGLGNQILRLFRSAMTPQDSGFLLIEKLPNVLELRHIGQASIGEAIG